MERRILSKVNFPFDLRKLKVEELEALASELREELINYVSQSGGHFASSLGALELTIALHYSFNTPYDRLVFDVGHQGYIHKMITGRRHLMPTIRKKGGLSGFLKRNESPYDVFGAGHAGTSISAAVGMAIAAKKKGEDRFIVPIIGDGSLTCGMAFEALNNAGELGLDNLIVILNDNDMSISPNVGALSWLFSRVVTSDVSTFAREKFKSLYKRGFVPKFVYWAIDKAEEATQGFLASPAMIFEAFGFRYIGPIDGHNIQELLSAIHRAKIQDVPVVIHAKTVKGKGFRPAEKDPLKWHGVKPFNPERAVASLEKTYKVEDKKEGVLINFDKKKPTYTEVFSKSLLKLIKRDPRIIAITAAMPTGTGLDLIEKEVPTAFLDVGICEQHAVTCAAGLACEGFKPICAIYSTFLQRAYDQVIHDVCIQKLPVVFAMDRGGAVGNDGETHQGAFDIAYLRCIPNIVLMAPKDENELQHMLYTAFTLNCPSALRYPRGSALGVELDADFKDIPVGKAEVLKEGEEVLFIGYGAGVKVALEAEKLLREDISLSSTVVNARFAKPLDSELLCSLIKEHKVTAVIEDGAKKGGFGSAILEMINKEEEKEGIKFSSRVILFGMEDFFTPHASQEEQFEMHSYDAPSVVKKIKEVLLKKTEDKSQRKIKVVNV
ncbi:MAG: 1-deoxy-D-xylulose-5-phosphate synthase [Candidatus Dadabacteria bacterium]|nr:MAG: 1-deoxy-D-xylulose-5-phosphate synthase [Candidatus Dadabacteria bacterium]